MSRVSKQQQHLQPVTVKATDKGCEDPSCFAPLTSRKCQYSMALQVAPINLQKNNLKITLLLQLYEDIE